jgi:hypothetical protein
MSAMQDGPAEAGDHFGLAVELSRSLAAKAQAEPRPPTCGICRTEHTAHSWARLRVIGHMPDGLGERLELRDCCGSSIALTVPDAPR